jgi:ABC-type phosphate transport system auxiliary subunit
MQRNRIKKLTKFAATAGFDKISSEFFVLIRNKIIDLKAKDYNSFTKDPVAYCHQQLEVFKMQKGEKNTDPELFEKIEQSINSYSKNLERKNEEKRLWLNSLEMTLEDEKVDEKGGAAKSSASLGEVKASADVQADSIQVSEKTESDSSTSVETEKSDD